MTQKKQISVRKQKIKKNHVREKLIFFYNTDPDTSGCCCFCTEALSV